MRGVFLLATCWLMADLLCVSTKFYLVKTKHSRHLKLEENADDKRSPEDPLPEITLDKNTTNVKDSEDSMSEGSQDNNSINPEDSMPEDTQDKNSTSLEDPLSEGTVDNISTTNANATFERDADTEENLESPESEDTHEPGSDYSLDDETGSHVDWSPENVPTLTLDRATDDSKKGSESGDTKSDWSPEHVLPSISLD